MEIKIHIAPIHGAAAGQAYNVGKHTGNTSLQFGTNIGLRRDTNPL